MRRNGHTLSPKHRCCAATGLLHNRINQPFFRGRAFYGAIIAAVLMGFARQHLVDPAETNV